MPEVLPAAASWAGAVPALPIQIWPGYRAVSTSCPRYAVRQPGVLQLLEALRRSGGNLRGVLDRMGHFAMGGLVGAPAFAGGGINGMNHVTIQFPGLPAIGGLRASSAVVDELRRSAALAQVRSGGRKPSRYT